MPLKAAGSSGGPNPLTVCFLSDRPGLTFAQEADETPDEVAAAVAEGRLGEGDFLEAVAHRGLLRPPFLGSRTRSPAVGGVGVRRAGPGRLGHVRKHRFITRTPHGVQQTDF